MDWEIGGGQEEPPSAMPLLRLARSTIERLKLAGLNLDIQALGDGRACLTAPVPWMELILAELERQVRVFAQQMRTVRAEELAREGERRALARQARGDYEREAAEILREYDALRARGRSHTEAIRAIRKARSSELRAWNVTSLTVVIYDARAMKRRRALEERAQRVTVWGEQPAWISSAQP